MDNERLAYIKDRLREEDELSLAGRILSFDQMTVCPRDGQEALGESLVTISSYSFPITHNDWFRQAVEAVYKDREELDEWDQVMIDSLYRTLRHEKNISREFNDEMTAVTNKAWQDWIRAKEADDRSIFLPSLKKVIEINKKRVKLWECDAREESLSLYGRMLDEFERGIRTEDLDRLFTESRERIVTLLRHIGRSYKEIRTDFLHRPVKDSQQRAFAEYLMSLMGFDTNRGYMAETEHPFTDRISRNDTRITTHYYPDNFLSSIYSVIHECGHALFEQLQPEENFTHHIADNKTMGMHESVSRFYENVIGRSRAFISLIYPKVCEIFPHVMRDVTEAELYEAVNLVTPSLIRTEADELTYTLHIIIRYEIEKELIDGHLSPEDAEALWEEKYEQYLGIRPEHDRDGILQDMHWASDFGYFPAYALGNFYNAMYFRTMKESFDPYEAVCRGDFAKINNWMREHVFRKADRLSSSEWIRDITGRTLIAGDYLDYLEEKYSELYELGGIDISDRLMDEYVRRTDRIRRLSTPQLDDLASAEAYSALLTDNFLRIGELAKDNRATLSKLVEPVLNSRDKLSREVIERMWEFNDLLINAGNAEELDVSMMSMVNDRLKADASEKGDLSYYIQQLDKEIIDCYLMANSTARISAVSDVSESYRRKGLASLDQLLAWLDKDRFLELDMDSRELVMINSRYGVCLYEYEYDDPSCKEASTKRLDMLERSLSFSKDPFYLEALPDYDWDYHTLRIYDYISITEPGGYANDNAKRIAGYMDLYKEFYEEDPEYYGSLTSHNELMQLMQMTRYRAGLLDRDTVMNNLYDIYKSRDKKCFDDDGFAENISVVFRYVKLSKYGPLDEKTRYIIDMMYRSAVSYAFRMPKLGHLSSWLSEYSTLVSDFPDIPGSMGFEELGLNLLAAFHPPTYIHSIMVAKLGSCLAGHLATLHPELFAGFDTGGPDSQEDIAKDRICEHTYHAGLCHDFGKLMIIDTVFIYGRSLLETEFEIIRAHAAMGAKLLSKHDSTKAYAEVAMWHHRWYDGSGGYPQDHNDTGVFPEEMETWRRVIIDIIECADCMDAATDRVGRSYNSGKTLDEFIHEMDEGSGTRYAPYMADLLHVQAVRRDLDFLLSRGRQSVYRDTYRLLKRVQDVTQDV